MKLSIVIAVYNSHEAVRRQLLYFQKLKLLGDVEIIIMDDGSEPPIDSTLAKYIDNCFIVPTNDKRRWTQGLARMKGIDIALGKYILCTDIDHIVSREAIEFAMKFKGDKAVFRRYFAYLDEYGNLIRDKQKLIEWGLNPAAIRDDVLASGYHGNTWLMRKQVFVDLGGYNLKRCNSETHLQGEDREFNKRYAVAVRAGQCNEQVNGPPIYFFPTGRYHATGKENPHGLFHDMVKEKWGDAH